MRRTTLTLLLLVLFASIAQAAPQITAIDPPVGFTYGATEVTLRGTDLASSAVQCPVPPPGGTGPGTCPVTVLFGGVEQHVNNASPTHINVTVLANTLLGSPTDRRVVDVQVVVPGKGAVTLPNAFTFDPFAVPGPQNYTAYLLPIVGLDVRGAFGSVWRHEWTIHNASVAALQVLAPYSIPIDPPPLNVVPPRGTERLDAYPVRTGGILYVPNPLVASTAMSLRTRDISKSAESWGVELPIVPLADFESGYALIDIPTDARYRAMLRIYAASMAPQTVHVRIFDPAQPEPIRELNVELEGIVNVAPVEFPFDPAYAQIDLLTPQVRAAAPSTIRVEVDNVVITSPPQAPIWAFVSITNNETQQVTTVTPQRP